MKFYSGFSLKNDAVFFESFIDTSAYCISGFSYGAIKAFENVKEDLKNGKRVDRLQLFSPAFFQNKKEKFKKIQEIAYTKNKEQYLKHFLEGCFTPHEVKSVEHTLTSVQELHELLYYEWDIKALEALEKQGVTIEVYLGGEDKIIDAKEAESFFLASTTVTYIKNANHFLQTQEGNSECQR